MTPATTTERTAVPWKRGLAWLLVLGPFFFASYGFATWTSAQREAVAVLAYAWERSIPFLPWTIVPYWSIDLIYGLSFLACRDEREVDRHGLRLLTVQVVAIACFLAWPMRFSFARPATDGVAGALYAALESFDQPFNQAPSLHIAILVVVWARVAPRLSGTPALAAHAWFALIGVSVLTTWQHHFVDLPTGALRGFLALWAWPDARPSPLSTLELTTDPTRRRIAVRYAVGALACSVVAVGVGGAAAWLWWPATSLALVALAYAAIGPASFQKDGGAHSPASAWLHAPYTLGAWANSRLWTGRRPTPDPVADGVWIGRMPTARELAARPFAAIVDLAAELPAPRAPGCASPRCRGSTSSRPRLTTCAARPTRSNARAARATCSSAARWATVAAPARSPPG
ncbi:MAG: phosphatase PAP2/dual specificity phosphatase family protein [Burkholderiales bacterium]